MQQAVLEVAGRISPTLDLTASLRNVTPAVARTVDFDLQADGTLTMEARLSGTIDEPRGTVKVAANGLRMRTGAAARLPAANLTANAELDGESARVDLKLAAGSQASLDVAGRIPLSKSGPVDVHADGTIDAAVANPILEVNGRRVKGKMTVDLHLSGTLDRPRIDGTLRIADGELQDYALGAHLTKIDALIEAAGDTVRIASFTADASPGTVSASGTVGVLAPGRPVDVKLTARNAKPLSTDLLSAVMDADVTLRGQSDKRVDAAGSIRISRAEINIPKALPQDVAVLDVRRPGQKAQPAPEPGPVIGFDLEVDAPRAVFVRGRGLDAETGGALRVTGTSASPQVSGGFDMRRGTFDLGASTPQVHLGQGELQRHGALAEDRSHARLRGREHGQQRHGEAHGHRLCRRAADRAHQLARDAAGRDPRAASLRGQRQELRRCSSRRSRARSPRSPAWAEASIRSRPRRRAWDSIDSRRPARRRAVRASKPGATCRSASTSAPGRARRAERRRWCRSI